MARKTTPPRSSSTLAGFLAGVGVAAVALLIIFMVRREPPSPQVTAPPATPPAATPAGPQPQPLPPFSEAEVAAAERITAERALALHREGAATFIDVRDVQSYRAAHIPGALQIPVVFVQGEVPFFPRDRKLIPYCT